MEHRIVAATARPDFTVDLVFDDKRTTVDLAATGIVTEPLRRDPERFANGLRIEDDGGWITWSGEVEIDADAL